MPHVRPPAVAGTFYPGDATLLRTMIEGYFKDVAPFNEPPPKAIIAPHAGYVYSGPIAATAYARVAAAKASIQRVLLLGPAHRVYVNGLATSSADAFATPLGEVPVDRQLIGQLLQLPAVTEQDEAHALEHSLEVHLPFLQYILDEFTVVPLVVGDATAEQVQSVLETVWDDAHTLIVISSDLSHYLSYDEARSLDRDTSDAIEALDVSALGQDQACGRIPIAGLLVAAKSHGLTAHTVDLRNSGDTAGSRDQVVGYGAYVFH